MIARYLFEHVSEISAWIGLLIIIGVLFWPRDVMLLFGVVLLIVKDESLKAFVAKAVPRMRAQLTKWSGQGEVLTNRKGFPEA